MLLLAKGQAAAALEKLLQVVGFELEHRKAFKAEWGSDLERRLNTTTTHQVLLNPGLDLPTYDWYTPT